ncbi:MAG: DegV family protein [Anaerolineae bacterium]
MKRLIKLVADSASDLSKSEADELGIDLVPLSVSIGKASYPENTITHDDYWRLSKGGVVSTSQPPIGAFSSVFRHWVDAGYHILCVTISSLMSGTYRSAEQAATEFAPHVTLVDSLAISRVTAIQLITASQLVRLGAGIQTIIQAMDNIRIRTHALLLLDTLEQLRSGGRAASILHLFERYARAFHIKPMITLVSGQLRFAHVSRSFRKGMDIMLHDMMGHKPADQMEVVHTRRPELADTFADELASGLGFERSRIIIREAGAVMSTHGGEGLISAIVVSAA